MNKVICIILTLFVLVGCATTGNFTWSNSNPQLHNQAVLNQDLAICKEYAYQASMGMPTKAESSGYNINYNEFGNINYNQIGNSGYGSINSTGYGSVTPQYTWGDAASELRMNLAKGNRQDEAFDNCMASKGWSKVQANNSSASYQGNQSNVPNYQWQTFFSDNFDNNNNRWLVEDNSTSSTQLQYGKYYFEHKRNYDAFMSYIRFNNNVLSNTNFAIETSIQKISGVDNYGYGLFFGKDFQNGYIFYITSNGHYKVFERKNNIASDVTPWEKHSAINTGNSSNILFVEKKGDVARFFINKTYIDAVNNLNYSGNVIAFSIDNNQKIAIDYLRVSK